MRLLVQDACLDFICDNLESICRPVAESPEGGGGELRLQFKDEETFFHTELSEQLLVRLCEKKKMDDMVLTLFDCRTTRLRYFLIHDPTFYVTVYDIFYLRFEGFSMAYYVRYFRCIYISLQR
jgi:hypothetical protein